MNIKQRWVIKAGSNMVVGGGPLLLRHWMNQVAELRSKHGIEVIWVTSGAIATAAERTGFGAKNRTLSEKQALSAIGQPAVMDLYNLSLGVAGLQGAQVLLTAGDIADRERSRNLSATLETLLKWKVVPVLNENDATATEEIRFGDNDRLSAKVARLVQADQLVILTDVDGVHDADPRVHKDARPIGSLDGIPKSLLSKLSKTAGSSRGTGGMHSKLAAAADALKAGIETRLVRGDRPGVLMALAAGQEIGTHIRARGKRGARRPVRGARR